MSSKLDYFKKIYKDKVQAEILDYDSVDDMKPKSLFTVQSSSIALPKGLPDFSLVAKNVAHFYIGVQVCVQWRTSINSNMFNCRI